MRIDSRREQLLEAISAHNQFNSTLFGKEAEEKRSLLWGGCLPFRQTASEAHRACRIRELHLYFRAPPANFFLSLPYLRFFVQQQGAYSLSGLSFSSQFHHEQLWLSLISMSRSTGCCLSRT